MNEELTKDDEKYWINRIHQGDSEDVLKEMPDSFINMVMTSPPYYNLRDYGCEGQIGLEDSLDQYIQNLVDVGEEIKRVLRDDGSWWLNIGDCYSTSRSDIYGGLMRDSTSQEEQGYTKHGSHSELKRKNRMFVPHRTAMALQDEGWIVRNDVVWQKPNPMPSSVEDRLNTTFEFIFHLVPEDKYWYDLDGIREPSKTDGEGRGWSIDGEWDEDSGKPRHTDDVTGDNHPLGKNPGDVFEVCTRPFSDAHFAVYPPKLIKKPLTATCPPKVCAECGKPYERDIERHDMAEDKERDDHPHTGGLDRAPSKWSSPEVSFYGWMQMCECETNETEAGIVLDPFIGAGTTAKVAKEMNRNYIGIDLSEEYVAMARARLNEKVENPEELKDTSFTPKQEHSPMEWGDE